MKPYIVAIITAGGKGKRLKTEIKKQFLCIKERPLLFWTIDNFARHSQIDEIIVALPREDIKIYHDQIYSEFTQSNISVVPGGPERQDSVCNAIHACHPKTDIVLIHDGVRPFVSEKEISDLIKIALYSKAVIPISKIKNTIKEIKNEHIIKTVNRGNLASALTPQVFDYNLIKTLHENAKIEELYFTDDAAILEHYGHLVSVYESESFNLKITAKIDFEIARNIIENKLIE